MIDDVLVVVSDPGGASQIGPLLRRMNMSTVRVVASDVAWVALRPSDNSVRLQRGSAFDALRDCSLVICGTSATHSDEVAVFSESRRLGVRCVAVLDHWHNYLPRFQRGGVLVYPDEVWAPGDLSFEIAKRELQGAIVKKIPDDRLVESLESIRLWRPRLGARGRQLLFLTEPITGYEPYRGYAMAVGYTESDAVRYLQSRLSDLASTEMITELVIRVHPRDERDHYENLLGTRDIRVRFRNRIPLELELAASTLVVGRETAPLYLSAMAGIDTRILVPPGGHPSVLKHFLGLLDI